MIPCYSCEMMLHLLCLSFRHLRGALQVQALSFPELRPQRLTQLMRRLTQQPLCRELGMDQMDKAAMPKIRALPQTW